MMYIINIMQYIKKVSLKSNFFVLVSLNNTELNNDTSILCNYFAAGIEFAS